MTQETEEGEFTLPTKTGTLSFLCLQISKFWSLTFGLQHLCLTLHFTLSLCSKTKLLHHLLPGPPICMRHCGISQSPLLHKSKLYLHV